MYEDVDFDIDVVVLLNADVEVVLEDDVDEPDIDDVVEVLWDDASREDDDEVRNDVDDDVEEDGNYVEVDFNVVNHLLDDEVVEVDVVDVLGDIAVVVSLVDVPVDDVVYVDLNEAVVAVVVVSELLMVNDDVDDVDVDHLGDVVFWLSFSAERMHRLRRGRTPPDAVFVSAAFTCKEGGPSALSGCAGFDGDTYHQAHDVCLGHTSWPCCWCTRLIFETGAVRRCEKGTIVASRDLGTVNPKGFWRGGASAGMGHTSMSGQGLF